MLQFNFAKSFDQEKRNRESNKRIRVDILDPNEPYVEEPSLETVRPSDPQFVDMLNRLGMLYYHNDKLSQNQVNEMIDPFYTKMVEIIINGYENYVYRPIFGNDKFIMALTRKLASEHSNGREDYYTMININTLLYQFMSNLDLSNISMLDLYKKLGYENNRNIIKKIMDVNTRGHNSEPISKDAALMLSIARYSEVNGDVVYSASRVNNTMKSIADCTKMFTEDVLFDLYPILVDSISALATGTFLRIGFDFNKTEESAKMENLQIKTLLDILETQTYPVIEYTLKEFTNRFNYRCSEIANFDKISIMRDTTPDAYPNIWRVVGKLQAEGFIVH